MPVLECHHDYKSYCSGEVIMYTSQSGMTMYPLCERHDSEHAVAMRKIARRYPEVNHPEVCGCWGCSEDSY